MRFLFLEPFLETDDDGDGDGGDDDDDDDDDDAPRPAGGQAAPSNELGTKSMPSWGPPYVSVWCSSGALEICLKIL